MKKILVRISSLVLIVALTGSIFAGCGKNESSTGDTTGTAASISASSTAAASSSVSGKISDETITLTYWGPMDTNSAQTLTNYAEMEMYKEMEKISNIKMEFKHPPVGQEKEQFNLLIASRDLPDLIEYTWGTLYPGGPEKAISDGIIVKLNDLIDKNAPNYKKILAENPVVAKQAKTDEQSLYAFPAIGMGYVKTSTGPFIRKDWLDDLGLALPETIDEWTNALTQFKEKKGATAPVTGLLGNFLTDAVTIVGAFGVSNDYFIDSGKVKYGPAEPGYKQYLELLRDWYKAGVLDPDFAASNPKAVDSNVTTNKSGIVVSGGIGGSLGSYLNTMKDKDPKFNMVALQYPVLKKGDQPNFTGRAWEVRTTNMLAITKVNKYPEESARWADYFYGEEGNLLKNFGIAGKTYNLENDYPKYSDLILKNPEGLSINAALGKYMRASTPAPGLIDSRYHEQYYQLQQQKDAMTMWSKVSDNSLKVLMPPVTATPEESEELAKITTTLDSYRKEMALKFIMGTESMDNYNKFLEQLTKLNYQRGVELKQEALDRYNKR